MIDQPHEAGLEIKGHDMKHHPAKLVTLNVSPDAHRIARQLRAMCGGKWAELNKPELTQREFNDYLMLKALEMYHKDLPWFLTPPV